MKKLTLKIKGMHCQSCATLIKSNLEDLDGTNSIKVSYEKETVALKFDENKTNEEKIKSVIDTQGYSCYLPTESKSLNHKIGWVLGIIGSLIVIYFLFHFFEGINLPQISKDMGYGLLFVVGLLTGFHCVSMCGGFVVSYTTKNAQDGTKSHKSHLMYGMGKTISYTVIGAAFGLLGSIIAFTPTIRSIAGIIAGLFLTLFGLKMLNIIPALRKFQFKTPKFISKFVGIKSKKHSNPLVIGLLNGLMIACGPLQAIYIMAAGTGSVLEGAKLLFIFALGTLPVMLGFGYFTSFVSNKMTHKILKASGAIVIVLGLLMINNGLTLAGNGYDFNSILTSFKDQTSDIPSENLPILKDNYQEINMVVDRYGWTPDKFILKKGVPVKWIINGKEINNCNKAIQVPKLGLVFNIKPGKQIIEFTPTEEGIIPWSCWMGMIPGTFIVSEDLELTQEEVEKSINSIQQPASSSCGGSCGSSTCGGSTGGGCGCGGR